MGRTAPSTPPQPRRGSVSDRKLIAAAVHLRAQARQALESVGRAEAKVARAEAELAAALDSLACAQAEADTSERAAQDAERLARGLNTYAFPGCAGFGVEN